MPVRQQPLQRSAPTRCAQPLAPLRLPHLTAGLKPQFPHFCKRKIFAYGLLNSFEIVIRAKEHGDYRVCASVYPRPCARLPSDGSLATSHFPTAAPALHLAATLALPSLCGFGAGVGKVQLSHRSAAWLQCAPPDDEGGEHRGSALFIELCSSTPPLGLAANLRDSRPENAGECTRSFLEA